MKNNLITIYKNAIGLEIEQLSEKISNIINIIPIDHQIVFRLKDLQNLIQKMNLKGINNPLLIKDIYGIKIIVDSVDQVYAVMLAIKNNFGGYTDHDYISKPKMCRHSKQNKGKFFRLIKYIAYQNKIPFEIQITTKEFELVNNTLHEGYHNIKYKKKAF
jgi:ppGpp synthetase/RelA/SpoT-type nucleotidyltranferase